MHKVQHGIILLHLTPKPLRRELIIKHHQTITALLRLCMVGCLRHITFLLLRLEPFSSMMHHRLIQEWPHKDNTTNNRLQPMDLVIRNKNMQLIHLNNHRWLQLLPLDSLTHLKMDMLMLMETKRLFQHLHPPHRPRMMKQARKPTKLRLKKRNMNTLDTWPSP